MLLGVLGQLGEGLPLLFRTLCAGAYTLRAPHLSPNRVPDDVPGRCAKSRAKLRV